MITTESELLEATADHIEKVGWLQHQYRNAAGAVCLAEGLDQVAGLRTDLFAKAVNRITLATGGLGMTSWNDMGERTQQQVLDLLREQAKVARKEEEA